MVVNREKMIKRTHCGTRAKRNKLEQLLLEFVAGKRAIRVAEDEI